MNKMDNKICLIHRYPISFTPSSPPSRSSSHRPPHPSSAPWPLLKEPGQSPRRSRHENLSIYPETPVEMSNLPSSPKPEERQKKIDNSPIPRHPESIPVLVKEGNRREPSSKPKKKIPKRNMHPSLPSMGVSLRSWFIKNAQFWFALSSPPSPPVENAPPPPLLGAVSLFRCKPTHACTAFLLKNQYRFLLPIPICTLGQAKSKRRRHQCSCVCCHRHRHRRRRCDCVVRELCTLLAVCKVC